MCKREIVVGIVCVVIGLGIGIAVSPKRTYTPLDQFTTYLSSFYSDKEGGKQGIKHAYSFIQDDITQCILLDKVYNKWRLSGVEFIISEYKYQLLSPEDKEGWHKLDYAYKSGMLAAPNANYQEAESLCSRLSSRYSKTFIFWNTDASVPTYGTLMYNFEKDGKILPKFIQQRDIMLNVNTSNLRNYRDYKPYKSTVPTRKN